jgi:SAM-dependent methyltransferase
LRLCDSAWPASINDYGCGYGALAARLQADGYRGAYCGYDVSPEMTRAAGQSVEVGPNYRFTSELSEVPLADVTLASGIFNVRLDTPVDVWESHVRGTLEEMASRSRFGFAFNVLTSYSDRDRMRGDLYYADPAVWLTYCIKQFGRHVALAHDYGLFEFTLLVRRRQDRS